MLAVRSSQPKLVLSQLGLPLGLVNTKPIENRPKIYDLVNRILVIEIEKTETEKYRKSWFGFW